MVDPYKSYGTLYSPPTPGKGPAIFVGTLSVLLVYGLIIWGVVSLFRLFL